MQSLELLDLSQCSIQLDKLNLESFLDDLTLLPHLTHLMLTDNPILTAHPSIKSKIIHNLTHLLVYNNKETEVSKNFIPIL